MQTRKDAKGIDLVVQGIEADDEIKARRILEHTRPNLAPSQASEALFLVHPYFVQFTPELALSQTQIEGAVRQLETSIRKWNKSGDPELQRETARLRACLKYVKSEGNVEDYLRRLEGLVSSVDTSKVKLVLVESVDDYWKQSARLVESGRFNSVLVTVNGRGILLESQRAALTESLEGVETAYVGGSYAASCPLTFARQLQSVGVKVVPVTDLLFAYAASPEMIPSMWREMGFKVQRAARTSQLPKVIH